MTRHAAATAMTRCSGAARIAIDDPLRDEQLHAYHRSLLQRWLIVSAGRVYGRVQSWRLSQLPARPRACFVAAVVVGAAVIFGGFVVGAAKGAVRVLPGPRYQVSVIGNSQTGWTTVPLSQFRL